MGALACPPARMCGHSQVSALIHTGAALAAALALATIASTALSSLAKVRDTIAQHQAGAGTTEIRFTVKDN